MSECGKHMARGENEVRDFQASSPRWIGCWAARPAEVEILKRPSKNPRGSRFPEDSRVNTADAPLGVA